MDNEKKENIIDSTNNEEETNVDESTEESQKQDDKKPKTSETLEAREARLERQLEQTRKKLGKTNSKQVDTETSNSSNLAEKAFLIANNIKGADEIEFVNKIKLETGKDIESLLESTYFQTEFKNFKEIKASSEATPTSSKRNTNSSVNTVEYWIAKGELPPVSEVQLRRDVVNARIKKEQSKGQFYNS